jgi:hypothetical protein
VDAMPQNMLHERPQLTEAEIDKLPGEVEHYFSAVFKPKSKEY